MSYSESEPCSGAVILGAFLRKRAVFGGVSVTCFAICCFSIASAVVDSCFPVSEACTVRPGLDVSREGSMWIMVRSWPKRLRLKKDLRSGRRVSQHITCPNRKCCPVNVRTM